MDKRMFRELWWDDRLENVQSEADPSWRHGCYMYEVYKDPSTDKYWGVSFQRTTDGEYHGLREMDFELNDVEPYVKTVTDYRIINKGLV